MAAKPKIRIFENFLPPDLQVEVLQVLREPRWNLGNAPEIKGEKEPAKLWHMNGLEEYPLFSETIFERITEALEGEYRIVRAYANGQMACQQGHLHTDDGALTFLYYPLQRWHPDWGGNLMLYNGPNVFGCISYIPNRAICFPAMIPHRAEAPSKNYDGLRVSVAWKLETA